MTRSSKLSLGWHWCPTWAETCVGLEYLRSFLIFEACCTSILGCDARIDLELVCGIVESEFTYDKARQNRSGLCCGCTGRKRAS
jgi:hypothetical protein